MGIVICPYEFDKPDPENPDYSQTEIDFYGWIPYDAQRKYKEGNHRLSLRKNLRTGKFELYKAYFDEVMRVLPDGLVWIAPLRETKIVVVYENEDLEKVLRVAHEYWELYHGKGKRQPDKVCQHKYPIKSLGCPVGDE